jgi:hypothetical protein
MLISAVFSAVGHAAIIRHILLSLTLSFGDVLVYGIYSSTGLLLLAAGGGGCGCGCFT